MIKRVSLTRPTFRKLPLPQEYQLKNSAFPISLNCPPATSSFQYPYSD